MGDNFSPLSNVETAHQYAIILVSKWSLSERESMAMELTYQ
jgi:hypothetical protein